MKNFLFLLIILFTVGSCSWNNSQPKFNTKKWVGEYRVSVPNMSDLIDKQENENPFVKGLAKLILTNFEFDANFYPEQKGSFLFDNWLFHLAGFESKFVEFDYKVENDSVLYLKQKPNSQYIPWAIIQNYSDNYDFIELKSYNKKELKLIFKKK